ncbi:MAG: hypothetical protein JWM16_406 [Verrucomicrobiales bacterium]|nr:hypothetical protein [Verrucomicrobiales bacterium]
MVKETKSNLSWSLMRYIYLAVTVLIFGGGLNLSAADKETNNPWHSIPLVKGGKVSSDWAQVGWGKFVADGKMIRSEPDERGIGLLVYTREKLGNCQIRTVFKGKTPRSNSGFYIRIDDGILDWTKKESPAVSRDDNGKMSEEMVTKLKGIADSEAGPWYAVHHGYEVQIMDAAGAHGTGSIYSLADAAPLPEKSEDGWRTMVITLNGSKVMVDIDGKRVSSFDSEAKVTRAKRNWTEPKLDTKRPEVGYIGLQTHDPEDIVWFKEVSVRPLGK